MNFWVDPLASSVSISGQRLSSLLLPGPFGRPTGRPEARLARRASFVRAEINLRSISAAIENTIAMILLVPVALDRVDSDFPLCRDGADFHAVEHGTSD